MTPAAVAVALVEALGISVVDGHGECDAIVSALHSLSFESGDQLGADAAISVCLDDFEVREQGHTWEMRADVLLLGGL